MPSHGRAGWPALLDEGRQRARAVWPQLGHESSAWRTPPFETEATRHDEGRKLLHLPAGP